MHETRSTVVSAGAAGVAGVAGSFAVAGFTPAFVGASVAAIVARLTPGVVVTAAITSLGDLGAVVNVAAGLALAALLFGALALAAVAIGRSLDTPLVAPVVAGAGAFAVAVLVTGAPLASLGAGVATGGTLAVSELFTRAEGDDPDDDRRRVLASLAAAAATVAPALLFGRTRGPGASEATGGESSGDPVVRRLLDEATERSLDVDGLEPLVSDEFYRVDISAAAPTIDPAEWRLTVTGAVDEQIEVGYDELTAMASQERFATLRCVGEPLNGRKMDTALWTVVPVAGLLDRAGVDGNCCVMVRAADGYYEEFPLAALRDGMLAYRMNGAPLPRRHGAPVRVLVPGHWGEINVKWVTEIEVLDEPAKGYWEERGWHGTGPVNTVAKLHAVNRDGDTIEVAGHAYAGIRGVSAVEVSTDGGETWEEATLSEPLPGSESEEQNAPEGASEQRPRADVWRQWAYQYESPGSAHEVVVRAREADGTLQPSDRTNAFPSGPTGWVSRELDG